MENAQLEVIKKETESILYEFQEVKPIETKETYNQAGDVIKSINFKIKKLEDKRVEWTKPILESKRKIDADFKSIIDPLDDLVGRIKKEMIVFAKVEQVRLDKEQKELEAKALADLKANKQSEVEVPVINEQKSSRGEISTSTVKEKWEFDIEDASKVPVEYLSPDPVKIKEAIKNGIRKIEGINIYDSGSITIR